MLRTKTTPWLKQITYITYSSDKIFFSQEACTSLNIITNNFPMIGDTMSDSVNAASVYRNHATPLPDCDCPRRQLQPPLPKAMPHPATSTNRASLQQYILEYYHSSTFNACKHQPIPMMEGPPLRLMISTDAKPIAHHTPVPVPVHLQEEVKAGLDRDVRLGLLELVPIEEPVTWCHRMVVCAKKNGKLRCTVHLQAQNVNASRDTHHTQSPFHQARSVSPGILKTVCNAWNGYNSVPLHQDDRHLTTLITPWGRYRYCTAPQGYIASGDGYSRRFDKIASDFPNKTKCIDDTLFWADSLEESFY